MVFDPFPSQQNAEAATALTERVVNRLWREREYRSVYANEETWTRQHKSTPSKTSEVKGNQNERYALSQSEEPCRADSMASNVANHWASDSTISVSREEN